MVFFTRFGVKWGKKKNPKLPKVVKNRNLIGLDIGYSVNRLQPGFFGLLPNQFPPPKNSK